ncbi:hypothetical protein DFQ27_005621 [Actinomortierella ambigua]|uniref:Uncharacterized protein n=1 Tax=Actinomortierella ambigua TaxID=1343610 RepID=A0A9P6QJP6_9FUNG|nr:hypothetical protein DFQ27_005621 [Actinomortierella ambigua]
MDHNQKTRGWSTIPHECTAIILSYLEHDTHALAALAQVDRAFFRIVCPVLYRNPFARLERMARVLHKPGMEIAQEQLEEHRLQPSQCCEHAKATERALMSLALPASERLPWPRTDNVLVHIPTYLDPAAMFAASPAVSWRYEALYKTLMEPILQVLHATYPSLHWPFLVHQHIRQLPMYDIPDCDAELVASTASKACQEVEQLKDDMVDEGLFDDGEPPCGGFDLGDDDEDDEGSNSSADEHASTTMVKKRDYLQYLQVIDLAYFPTRSGGHNRHYRLHGPYQRVMLGHHSRFHSTNPTNAKFHRDYGMLYCIWDRSPKAVAFQHSMQKVYTPQSGVLDMIQRLLLARYPSKVQALRLPSSRLKAFDLDPTLFSAQAHRAIQPTPMPFRSAFIARRMTHLSRIEIHGLSHSAEEWRTLRDVLAYLAAVNGPVHTIRELSIRPLSSYRPCGYWMQRVLAALPKLEVLEAHGVAETTCLIHSGGSRQAPVHVWTPCQTAQDQSLGQGQGGGQEGGGEGSLQNGHGDNQGPPGYLYPCMETPSNSQGAWMRKDSTPLDVACECHWLSTWSVKHGQSLRVLDIDSSDSIGMQWRQYNDLARFPNLKELRLVGRDQDMFEWVLDGREKRRQQQGGSRLASQGEHKNGFITTTTTAIATQKQQQETPQGTLDQLKKLSLVLRDESVAGVLIDRCNFIFGKQLEELVLVLPDYGTLLRSWRFSHTFSSLRRLAIRGYMLKKVDMACLGPDTCPQLEMLILRYTVLWGRAEPPEEYMQMRMLGRAANIEEADRHVEQDIVPALKGLTRLRSLWLEGRWFMTTKAVSVIALELSHLCTLGLQDCPNVKASSTELKKMVAEIRGGGGDGGGSQNPAGLSQVSADTRYDGAKDVHGMKRRPLELRWINADLPTTHAWAWQDTKILYDL